MRTGLELGGNRSRPPRLLLLPLLYLRMRWFPPLRAGRASGSGARVAEARGEHGERLVRRVEGGATRTRVRVQYSYGDKLPR